MSDVFGSSRGRFAVAVSAFTLCAAIGLQAGFAPSALSQESESNQSNGETSQAPLPDDVAGLIEEVRKVARDVSAKNEKVKELEDELAAKEEELVSLEAAAVEANREADEAEAQLQAQQANVDGIAQSRYRGDTGSVYCHAECGGPDQRCGAFRLSGCYFTGCAALIGLYR